VSRLDDVELALLFTRWFSSNALPYSHSRVKKNQNFH